MKGEFDGKLSHADGKEEAKDIPRFAGIEGYEQCPEDGQFAQHWEVWIVTRKSLLRKCTP